MSYTLSASHVRRPRGAKTPVKVGMRVFGSDKGQLVAMHHRSKHALFEVGVVAEATVPAVVRVCSGEALPVGVLVKVAELPAATLEAVIP